MGLYPCVKNKFIGQTRSRAENQESGVENYGFSISSIDSTYQTYQSFDNRLVDEP